MNVNSLSHPPPLTQLNRFCCPTVAVYERCHGAQRRVAEIHRFRYGFSARLMWVFARLKQKITILDLNHQMRGAGIHLDHPL